MAGRMREKKKEEMRNNKLVVVHDDDHHQTKRVPVVYYLSRDGQLQHPHFMEVPLSSPQAGLFLTDFVNRLSVLRGKSMPAMYSWSCKRSYKNGFVWHDLSGKDFIYPAHGHDEYVLKGSELLLPEDNKDTPPEKPQQERRRRNQSCSSIDTNHLQEYSVYQSSSDAAAADASTQTDDARRLRRPPPERDEIEVSTSPPASDSSPETLETLMEVDRRRRETAKGSTSKVGGRSSVLMQLISCGSISCGAGQGHNMMGMGLISQYKTRVPRAKLEEKEFFSGSILADTKKEKFPTLKRSTSCNAPDR